MNLDRLYALLKFVFLFMILISENSFSLGVNKVYVSYDGVNYTNGRMMLAYKVINNTSTEVLIPEEYLCQKNPLISRDVFEIRELGSEDVLKYNGPFFNVIGGSEFFIMAANSIVECETWLNLSYSVEFGSGKKYEVKSMIRYKLPGEDKYFLVDSEPYVLE